MGKMKKYLLFYNTFGLIGSIISLILLWRATLEGPCWGSNKYFLSENGSTSYLSNRLLAMRLVVVMQFIAILEVIHIIIKVVRSSLLATTLQILSRIVVAGLVIRGSNYEVSEMPETAIMISVWCLAEIIRYSWYICKLSSIEIKSLTWLRFSAFLVLYPIGIYGELAITLGYLKTLKQSLGGSISFLLLTGVFCYIPGSPFLYTRLLKTRQLKLKGVQRCNLKYGVLFPSELNGKCSTMNVNRSVYGAALDSIDKDSAELCKNEKAWRSNYGYHALKLAHLEGQSEENEKIIANRSLEYIYNKFIWKDKKTGEQVTLEEAYKTLIIDSTNKWIFPTILGNGEIPTSLKVPFKPDNKATLINGQEYTWIDGDKLLTEIKQLYNKSAINRESKEMLLDVIRKEDEVLNSLQSATTVYILLGAKSALGPFEPLIKNGATVMPIMRKGSYPSLIKYSEQYCGTLIIPVDSSQTRSDDFEMTGFDLIEDAIEVAKCIRQYIIQEKPVSVVIGSYTYLDGADFVRISLANDLVMRAAVDAAKETNFTRVTISSLPSPTAILPIDSESLTERLRLKRNSPFWLEMIRALGVFFSPKFQPDTTKFDGKPVAISQGIVKAQGPNYLLAKQLQLWRSQKVIYDQSANSVVILAPASRTQSVEKNFLFAASYDAFKYMPALIAFNQNTAKYLLFIALISKSELNKSSPKNKLDLVSQLAIHGGVWTCPYTMESLGPITVITTLILRYIGIGLGVFTGLLTIYFVFL